MDALFNSGATDPTPQFVDDDLLNISINHNTKSLFTAALVVAGTRAV